ncbi:hypothetical protein ACQP00_03890 [Dactylosporangium sp. CS-047395]|uniref:hypothetical protein n=1 Tax=Dactylosporangium sp. CS-047395 TaxID=3239936 RepID=UPI003D915DBA
MHVWTATGLIALGVAIRTTLIALGWPETNSDEGFIGLMGLHIAYQGELPTFYPGQFYMGPHEAFLGAALFQLFGTSLFVLRLGMVLLFAVFLVSSYLFTRLVYGPRWALITLALLALGSPYVFARELSAIGGYGETLAISSLLFLLAAWLVTTYRPYRVFRECRWRLAAYAAWGVLAGTGLWSDLLIAPFALMSGVVLVLYCWREFVQLAAPVIAGAGLVLGMFPLLWFNLHAAPGTDTLTTLSVVRGTPPEGLEAKLHALWDAVRVSVPMMTGEPFCQANELAAIGPTTSWARPCSLSRAGWGTGYMVLLGIATLLAAWLLWRAWRNRRTEPTGSRRPSLHFAMLLAALITFYLFAFSNAAVVWPAIHARYLIGFVIALPAVFRPLAEGFTWARERAGLFPKLLRLACAAGVLGYGLALVLGTGAAFADVPRVREINRTDAALVSTLHREGVEHFYSDYWTCAKIAFRAEEQITCASTNEALDMGPGQNRYYQYWVDTTADPRAAYVFADNPCRSLPWFNCKGSPFLQKSNGTYRLPAVEAILDKAGKTYRVEHVDGYVIYLVN